MSRLATYFYSLKYQHSSRVDECLTHVGHNTCMLCVGIILLEPHDYGCKWIRYEMDIVLIMSEKILTNI